MTNTIISSSASREGKTRIVFQHVLNGVIYGPSIADRPSEEDHQSWLDAQGEQLELNITNPIVEGMD